jgi:hypothetical protein
MGDLYTPSHYIIGNQYSRVNDSVFSATLKFCSLFREELFLTDRFLSHCAALHKLWHTDRCLNQVICSPIVKVGSFEHPDGDDRQLNLAETIDRALAGSMVDDPENFRNIQSDPYCREFVSDFDRRKPMLPSPIFVRDDIFTSLIMNTLEHHFDELLLSISRSTEHFSDHLGASSLNYTNLKDELYSIMQKIIAGTRKGNFAEHGTIGIIHFFPLKHVKSRHWNTFFYILASNEDNFPILSLLMRDRCVKADFMRWINLLYIKAEAESFLQSVILSPITQDWDFMMAGNVAAGFDAATHDQSPIKIESLLTNIETINLLSFDDIMELRDRRTSKSADAFFGMLKGEGGSLSVNNAKDVVAAYLHNIESRLSSMKSHVYRDKTQRILISAMSFSNKILIRIKSFLDKNRSYSSVVTAAASAKMLFPIPVDIVVDVAVKGTDRALSMLESDLRTRIAGEIFNPTSRESILKIK